MKKRIWDAIVQSVFLFVVLSLIYKFLNHNKDWFGLAALWSFVWGIGQIVGKSIANTKKSFWKIFFQDIIAIMLVIIITVLAMGLFFMQANAYYSYYIIIAFAVSIFQFSFVSNDHHKHQNKEKRKFATKKKQKAILEASSKDSQNKIYCDTKELRELIVEWTGRERWEFEHFADFLEQVGVKTPVKLSEFNNEKRSFKCVTALNSEVLISLIFGDGWDYCSEIHVTEGEETRKYQSNYNANKGKSVPEAKLQGRDINRNGKKLSNYYCQFFCNRKLNLDSTHTLEIEIYEPSQEGEKNEISVLRNCSAIENYLLGLDVSLVVSNVYYEVMKLLAFSEVDISNSCKILFSYTEKVDGKERILGKILRTNGVMKEYAVSEKGETFHVFDNGDWRYFYNGMRISYIEEKKNYDFTITGAEDDIIKATPSGILERVERKISELWKFVKE